MTLKKNLGLVIVISVILFSGCWDKIEIDNRAFVLGLVVDSADKGKDTSSEGGSDVNVAFYMPIPSKLLSGSVDAFSVEKSKGKDVPKAIENLSMQFSRQIFLGETKIILLGEKLLKDNKNLKKIVDFFERDPDMGRDARIVVLKGDTKTLENVKPKFENVFASYVGGVINNSASIFSEMSLSLNEFLSMLRENKGSITMPAAEVIGDKISVKNIALIKDYKQTGYLDKKYILPFSIITNKLKDGNYSIKYKNNLLSCKITSSNTRIRLESQGNNLEYTLEPRIEMDIDNFVIDEDIFKDKVIMEIKDKLASSIKEELTKTVEYFQNDIGFDYFKLEQFTKKYHYSIFEKYKDNWNEEFKKAKFNFNVTVFIRRIGGTRK
jgi:Ger(x)C family germination protein